MTNWDEPSVNWYAFLRQCRKELRRVSSLSRGAHGPRRVWWLELAGAGFTKD